MKKDYLEKTTEYLNGKVLKFDDSPERYLSLTEKHVDKEDLLGALSFAFAGYNKKASLSAISDIADIYADMGLYELSNKYWYQYLAKAPKSKISIAYEELAINYFYLNNFPLSGYYFHAKLSEDGFISRDKLDLEIVSFFDKMSGDKSKYRIVYPEEKIDYKEIIKDAKKSIMIGDYQGAIKKYLSVPEFAKEYKIAREELCFCAFLSGDEEQALSTNKDFIKEFGPSASVFCNLSEIYRLKEDREKSRYYYEQALINDDLQEETAYKIASCALEHGEYKIAVKYFEKIVDDKIYDVELLLLFGMALINSGDFERGQKIYSKAYRINPYNQVSAHYAKFSQNLYENGGKGFDNIKSANELPEEQKKIKANQIKKILSGEKESFFTAIKDKKILENIRWGITSGGFELAENCIRMLVLADTIESKNILQELLIDSSVKDRIKEAIVFLTVLGGSKKRLSVTVGGFFIKIKPGKPLCESDPGGTLFFASYALAFSRLMAAGNENLDKIQKATDKIYLRLRDESLPETVSREEISAMILLESGLKFIKSKSDACGFFGAKPHKLEELYKIYSKEKNND